MTAADYEKVVSDYEALQETLYQIGKARLRAEGHWLATAFSNEGSDAVRVTVTETGFDVHASVWTNQTGGSHERVEFTVTFEEYAEVAA